MSASLYSTHGLGAYRAHTMSREHLASRRSLVPTASRTNLNYPPFEVAARSYKVIDERLSASAARLRPHTASNAQLEGLAAWASANGGPAARAARPLTPVHLRPPPGMASQHNGLVKPKKQTFSRPNLTAAGTEALRKKFETGVNKKYKDLTKAFQRMDNDRSGTMSNEEVMKAMLSMQLHCDEDELEELMRSCDLNGDGHIDFSEFKQGIMKISHEHGAWHPGINQPLKAMVLKHDLGAHTDDAATAKEVQTYMKQIKGAVDAKYNALRKAFMAIDSDRSNYLSRAEIVDAVQHFALPIPEAHINEVFENVFDVNGDGQISYTEFCDKMKDCDFGI